MDLNIKILSDIIHYMKYAKYIPELNRRETWEESCKRNRDMHVKKYPHLKSEINDIYDKYVIPKKVLVSMRSMHFAGKAIEIAPHRIYNCSFNVIDCINSFPEMMFNLLSGCGVGYSIQAHHVDKLPHIRKPLVTRRYLVSDNVIGWSEAVRALIKAYMDDKFLPKFDFRDIRPKGTPLKTTGGTAPGPEPLQHCLEKIKKILDQKEDGSKLTTFEVHRLICVIADTILSGGIRRAALISFFNIDDNTMLKCKSNYPVQELLKESINGGRAYSVKIKNLFDDTEHMLTFSEEEYKKMKETNALPWWYFYPELGRANNSAVFVRHKVTKRDFKKFWTLLKENKTGEPGIFFTNSPEMLSNPCCEVSLKNNQYCNLTEINFSNIDSQEELNKRAKAAAFLGTLQAGYTDFHYLHDDWRRTTEREALLGVSLNGISSSEYCNFNLEQAASLVLEENSRVSDLINISEAYRTTTVKPSGTSSLILGTSAGIHSWYSPYYIRRVKISKDEVMYSYLSKNIPQLLEDDKFNPSKDAYICIPVAAPNNAIVKDNEKALDFLERIKYVKENWINPGHRKGDNTHNVSATVYIKDEEWEEVGKWMWDNRNSYNGLTVLPLDDNTYVQAPHEEISKEKYDEMTKYLKTIDLTKIKEQEDKTKVTAELACTGTSCTVK